MQASDLVIVAHPDDDLLFMQPDLTDLLAAGGAVTTVYVTAGDGGNGVATSENRLRALEAAYGMAVGSQQWSCGWIDLRGHTARHCRLADRPVSLVVLGVPDGGVNATAPEGLSHLFDGSIASSQTISAHPTRYDLPALVGVLAQVIEDTHPETVRTLDIGVTHGPDHPDHLFTGTLASLARAAADSDAALLSYRGYNINYVPATTPDAIAQPASLPMRAYEACVTTGCGVCGRDACPTLTDARYEAFVHRHFALGARTSQQGLLRMDDGCVQVADDGSVAIAACDQAVAMKIEPDGMIRAGDRCLEVEPDGSVLASDDCTAAPERAFVLDDEGHLWTGVPPQPDGVTITMHATCLGVADGVVRADLCGADRDPRWRLERPAVATARGDLGVFASGATGRGVRLANLLGDAQADLCTATGSSLVCATGDGTGRFGTVRRIDAPGAPLAIDPDSLAIGDVDGDGRPDACGRGPGGLICATAASGYRAAPASSPLPSGMDVTSLAISDGQLCAIAPTGAMCASPGDSEAAVLTTWPQDLPVWFADLDGDGATDWCAAAGSGPACGLAADHALTSDGVGWGYSLSTLVEGSTLTDGTIGSPLRALGDVTGDGLADLCEVIGTAVMCATSEGHGFRPRAQWLELPAGAVARALWLGDLDGDGRLDPCVDTGDAIRCALSP